MGCDITWTEPTHTRAILYRQNDPETTAHGKRCWLAAPSEQALNKGQRRRTLHPKKMLCTGAREWS